MNRIVLLGMAGGMLGIAGCGSSAMDVIQTDTFYTRSMAMQTNAAGEATGVTDRSVDEGTMTTTQRFVSGRPDTASVDPAGTMGLGTTVPGDDGLLGDPTSANDYIATYENSDSFLGELQEGNDYALAAYRTDLGDRRYVSYGVTRGNETVNMPVAGEAHYVGKAYGTVYGSQTGQSQLVGDSRLRAQFDPILSTVDGRLENLRLIQGVDNMPLGSDIRLMPSAIGGSGYHGAVQVVQPGSNAEAGLGSFGSYDGDFYGASARETAGTFQFNAAQIPIAGSPVPAFEDMQGVGAFGASE